MQKPQLKKRGRPAGYVAAPDPLISQIIESTSRGEGYLLPGPFDRKSAMTFRQKLKRHGNYHGIKFSLQMTVDNGLWITRVAQE
jgi:hypothetical protein